MATSPTPSKADLRTRALAARRAMTPDGREVAGAAIARVVLSLDEVIAANTVASYLSFGTEPATNDLVEALRSRGARVLVPVLRDDLDLDWAEYVGMHRIAQGSTELWKADGSRLGLDAIAACEVVLVPALAVDDEGIRLGRGGGSYDRALARVPEGRSVVALLYDGERLAAVPHEAHDRPVTTLVTPTEVVRFA